MDVITMVVFLGALATMVTMFAGVGSMAEGGEFDDRHSHQWMFARVGFQGLTVALVLIALLAQLK